MPLVVNFAGLLLKSKSFSLIENASVALKPVEANKDNILDLAKKHYENLVEVLTNNAFDTASSSSNPTSSVPSSSIFPNLFDQNDAYRIKEPEIYDNYNGDIAESYTNSLGRLMGH